MNYARTAANATAAIKRAGTTGVLVHFTKTNDPTTGAVSGSTAAKGPIDLVVLPITSRDTIDIQSERLLEALTTGSLRKMLVGASSAPFVPKVLDVVQVASANWIVLGLKKLSPDATTNLLYTLYVEATNLTAQDIAAIG